MFLILRIKARGSVRVAGLIPAGSKPPDVTLMYISVFRLLTETSVTDRPAVQWERGSAPVRGCDWSARWQGAGLWDYSSISLCRSSGHLEQPCPGIKPPSSDIPHRASRASLTVSRGKRSRAPVLLSRLSGLISALRRDGRTVSAGKNKEIRIKPRRGVMDWTDPTSKRVLGPMEAATHLDLVCLDPGSDCSLDQRVPCVPGGLIDLFLS